MQHLPRTLSLITAAAVAAVIAPAAAVPASADAASRLVIRGGGFGHGVGMSQTGAVGMASRGYGYERILRHYYRGIELERWY